MTPATRQEVLGLYRKILQIAKNWQSASGQIEETMKEKEYIRNEARTLFRKNKNSKYHVWVESSLLSLTPDSLWALTFSAINPELLSLENPNLTFYGCGKHNYCVLGIAKISQGKVTDPKLIKQCIEECEARIEIGLHYNIPYPRPIHLPPMGLAHKQGRTLRHQEKLRKISKPIYLKSHDEVS